MMVAKGADKPKRPYLVLLLKYFYKVKVPPNKNVLQLKEMFTKAYTDSTVASVVVDEASVVIFNDESRVVFNVALVVGDLDNDCLSSVNDEGK